MTCLHSPLCDVYRRIKKIIFVYFLLYEPSLWLVYLHAPFFYNWLSGPWNCSFFLSCVDDCESGNTPRGGCSCAAGRAAKRIPCGAAGSHGPGPLAHRRPRLRRTEFGAVAAVFKKISGPPCLGRVQNLPRGFGDWAQNPPLER